LFIGFDHVIDAVVVADPLPDVTWQKYDGFKWVDVLKYSSKQRKVITGRPKYNICPNNGSLSIPELSSSNDGDYKVILQGIKGLKERKTRVKVQQQASIIRAEIKKETANKNEYTITCPAVGLPKPVITFKDRLQKPVTEKPSSVDVEGKVVATLKIKTNHSTLTCKATNKYGSDSVTIGLSTDLPLWEKPGRTRTKEEQEQLGAKYEAAKQAAEDKRTGFIILLSLGIGVSLLVFFIIYCVLRAIRARNLKKQQLSNESDEEVVLVDTTKKKKAKSKDVENAPQSKKTVISKERPTHSKTGSRPTKQTRPGKGSPPDRHSKPGAKSDKSPQPARPDRPPTKSHRSHGAEGYGKSHGKSHAVKSHGVKKHGDGGKHGDGVKKHGAVRKKREE